MPLKTSEEKQDLILKVFIILKPNQNVENLSLNGLTHKKEQNIV